MQIDMRVMELLSSKLCHDLVSPVSAINNGVELIEDIGGAVMDEAIKLISDSGGTAARRLKMYRLTYGRAGSETSLDVKDVKLIAEQYLEKTKISLVWPEGLPSAAMAERKGFFKTLLNLIILGEESLAYGGVITLRNLKAEGDEEGCRVEVVGRNVSLNLQLQEALEGSASIEELSPRSVHSYVTGRFAEYFGFKLVHDHSIPDRLDLLLTPKKDEEAGMQSVKVS